MAREILFDLGKMITDRLPYKFGLKRLTENDPEYIILDRACSSDEIAEVMLKMELRKPKTTAEIAKLTGKSEERIVELLTDAANHGIVEYNYENPKHEKQWYVQLFVPGIAEMTNMVLWQVEKYPELADSFNKMTFLPLEGKTHLIPPGGDGVGMHVIPVEKAIPAKNESASIEHISHWLDKYDGHFSVGYCSCRNARRLFGEGSGEIQDDCCIGLGDFADYLVETGKGRYITREEVLQICQRAEDNGYVHQVTNIDGSDKIFGLCNCDLGVCFALRTSQYFNTPNLSASAYRAHVDKDNCVACGKCVEVCPAGAVKLGQKLCTKNGEVEYPKQELPTGLKWGKDKWNPDYVTDNRKNCHESGTAPCKTACPAHIAIQGYIKLAKEGRYLDALKLIKQDNPFPSVCGYVCNRRCEAACTRGSLDKALAIDEIKKFIAEQDLKSEERYIPEKLYRRPVDIPYEQKVAIIGAGPAGLSCAYYLARMGYTNVTVFDRNPAPGGMLVMGIPSYRLDRSALKGEIEVLEKMGVHFQMNTEIGKDITIQQLRDEGYKGFYVAIGAQKSSKLRIPGEDLTGVYGGVDFLREVNLGNKPEIGKKCAVIGGGNVAMDVCRTAVRLGAETTVIYRRSEDEMPADKEEVAEAREEGVKFCFLNAPVEILGNDGKVCGLKVEIMELGEPDEKGRRSPVGTGKFETIEVDSVLAAVGQSIDWGSLDIGELRTGKKGNAIADPVTYQTEQKDIFVGGDVYTGPKFAIDAIAAGREGAESLHRFVNEGQSLTISRNLREFYELDKENLLIDMDCFDRPARQAICHDASKAKTFEHDRLTFTEEQVKAEASRCLGCGVSVVDRNRCIGCGLCTTRCMFDAIHLQRDVPEASTMVRCEDKVGPMLKYVAKRAIKINRKEK
ncbi:MAG TPA: pyridine nucleotide-disulfide oxidoreductase [Clostridiales bacterium]|nr:pyridine nucleotide-disulfide oxidoreductase [Clostridiales bacterium]